MDPLNMAQGRVDEPSEDFGESAESFAAQTMNDLRAVAAAADAEASRSKSGRIILYGVVGYVLYRAFLK